MPREGTENIKQLLFAPDRTRVDLGPWAQVQLGQPLPATPKTVAGGR